MGDRWKTFIKTSKFHNCEDCPKYYYDMEDGDLCIMGAISRSVNKFGEGIPEWCPLEYTKDPNER